MKINTTELLQAATTLKAMLKHHRIYFDVISDDTLKIYGENADIIAEVEVGISGGSNPNAVQYFSCDVYPLIKVLKTLENNEAEVSFEQDEHKDLYLIIKDQKTLGVLSCFREQKITRYVDYIDYNDYITRFDIDSKTFANIMRFADKAVGELDEEFHTEDIHIFVDHDDSTVHFIGTDKYILTWSAIKPKNYTYKETKNLFVHVNPQIVNVVQYLPEENIAFSIYDLNNHCSALICSGTTNIFVKKLQYHENNKIISWFFDNTRNKYCDLPQHRLNELFDAFKEVGVKSTDTIEVKIKDKQCTVSNTTTGNSKELQIEYPEKLYIKILGKILKKVLSAMKMCNNDYYVKITTPQNEKQPTMLFLSWDNKSFIDRGLIFVATQQKWQEGVDDGKEALEVSQ